MSVPTAATGAAAHGEGTSSPAYQIALVTLLSVNFGIVFFDRNALGFLMPFIQPDLRLSDFEVGMLSSALSLTWACAAFGIGIVSDRTGSRKGLLVATTLLFSACSFFSGIAASFAVLLGARLLMGVAEGGIMPISQSIIASEVRPGLRGIAMGVTQNFGSNLLGSFLAPVVLAGFAMAHGWRHAFFLAGVPGLIMALLMWKSLDSGVGADAQGRDVSASGASRAGVQPEAQAQSPKASLGAALIDRNVVLCALMGVLLVSYFVVCLAFMPLYLVRVRHYAPETEGWLIGVLVISATVGAFVISGLSDRIGRRPLMILMPLIAVILPLGALYYHGSVWILAAIFFVGWGQTGIFPLFMATVPSESVSPNLRASALGLCMGTGEILGGVASPSLAGLAADHFGLQAPLWIMLGLAVVGAALALGLRETAPRVLE
ncbi:MAG: MFS transporter, partial [Steroidobacteraceae bacterium]